MITEESMGGWQGAASGSIDFVPEPAAAVMQRTKGRNLLAVGWLNGTLYCEFPGGRQYKYFGVPEDECNKLLRSPFPDKLFTTNIKGKFTSEKVSEK